MCEARGRVGYVTLLAFVLALFPSQARGNATRAHLQHCTSQGNLPRWRGRITISERRITRIGQDRTRKDVRVGGSPQVFPRFSPRSTWRVWVLDSCGDGEWIDIAFRQTETGERMDTRRNNNDNLTSILFLVSRDQFAELVIETNRKLPEIKLPTPA